MFVAQNIQHRRNICLQAKIQTRQRGFGTTAQQLAAIDTKTLEAALKLMKDKADGKQADGAVDPAVTTLLSQLQSVGGRIAGSDWSRKGTLRRINSSMLRHGTPSFYMTINLAEVYNRGQLPNHHHPMSFTFHTQCFSDPECCVIGCRCIR